MIPSARRVSPPAHSILAVFTSLSSSQHPELLLLFQHQLSCCLSTDFLNASHSFSRSAGLAYFPLEQLSADRPWWMRALAMEIMRGCVFPLLIIINTLMALIDRPLSHTRRFCGDAGNATMPWLLTATQAVPLAHVFSHSLLPPRSASSHTIRYYSAYIRKCRAWVWPRAIRYRISIVTVWTASRGWW